MGDGRWAMGDGRWAMGAGAASDQREAAARVGGAAAEDCGVSSLLAVPCRGNRGRRWAHGSATGRPNSRPDGSTENENGHRAVCSVTVCTGCFRAHSHELFVPLQHFGCMSQPTCCGVQPSTTTIQPGYNRSTTRVQPQRIAAARIARACLVLWLWVMAGEEAGARTADDVMGMVGGGGGGARRAGWVDVVQSRLRQRQCSAGCGK